MTPHRTAASESLSNTIFVVDDDDAVRDSISALLEINDRRVKACSSAIHFLEQYHDRAHCLLLDVEMPGMTGIELVTRLADQARLPPTVLMTAHSGEPTTKSMLLLGVHAILPKPTSELTLLAAIDGAVMTHKGNHL